MNKKLISVSDNLKHRRARNLQDYLALRALRNSGFRLLTTYPKKISLAKQFFFYLQRKEHEIYIFTLNSHDVSYVLLSRRGLKTFITILVDPEFHGMGIGTNSIITILRYYQNNREIYAEIDRGNSGSIKLFESIGFKNISNEKKLLLYKSSI